MKEYDKVILKIRGLLKKKGYDLKDIKLIFEKGALITQTELFFGRLPDLEEPKQKPKPKPKPKKKKKDIDDDDLFDDDDDDDSDDDSDDEDFDDDDF